MDCFIYGIYENGNDNCLYIGSTKNFKHRIAQHRVDSRKRKSKLYNYLNKKDWEEDIEFILLEYLNVTNKYELYNIEREYLKHLQPLLNTNQPPFKKI